MAMRRKVSLLRARPSRRWEVSIDIHRVVLTRLDGSELQRSFLAATDAPRVGSTIQLPISDDGLAPVSAKNHIGEDRHFYIA